MFDFVNLATVGLALDIVGVIFLANAMGIRGPRRFIREHFGIRPRQPLRAVLDQLRAKAEIFVGFLFLLMGFSLQIVAALAPPLGPPSGTDESVLRLQAAAFALLAVAVLATTALLRAGCRAWSLALFRKLMAEFFAEHHEWQFEKHPALTREIGEVLSVPPHEDDSIGDYANRVRAALRLAPRPGRRAAGDDAFAPVRKVGGGRRS